MPRYSIFAIFLVLILAPIVSNRLLINYCVFYGTPAAATIKSKKLTSFADMSAVEEIYYMLGYCGNSYCGAADSELAREHVSVTYEYQNQAGKILADSRDFATTTYDMDHENTIGNKININYLTRLNYSCITAKSKTEPSLYVSTIAPVVLLLAVLVFMRRKKSSSNFSWPEND